MSKKEDKRISKMKDLSKLKESIPPANGEKLLDWEGEKISMAEWKKRFVEKFRPSSEEKVC